jgi:sensor histidine kinase regulating citrate/malate metabolism
MNTSAETINTPSKNNRRILLITILIGLSLAAAIWILKEVQMNNIKKDAERDRQSLQDKVAKQIIDSKKENLKVLAKPYVWAVRSEMLKGNISQVNLYANEMVKEGNFESVMVADGQGIIISSTNKKDEGLQFSTISNSAYLSSDSTMVNSRTDSILVMSSPIMGFNNRLGTLIITYALPRIEYK